MRLLVRVRMLKSLSAGHIMYVIRDCPNAGP